MPGPSCVRRSPLSSYRRPERYGYHNDSTAAESSCCTRLRGYGSTPLRHFGGCCRSAAYPGLRALASLSLARSEGRHRFRGAWREPKLFIIYVVDAEGKLDRSFMPIIDALIRGPDAMFKLLHAYLSQLNLSEADQVLFIADGAPWIWNRIPDLIKRLGLAPDQVHQLIDF